MNDHELYELLAEAERRVKELTQELKETELRLLLAQAELNHLNFKVQERQDRDW